jgi:hypothetical protein
VPQVESQYVKDGKSSRMDNSLTDAANQAAADAIRTGRGSATARDGFDSWHQNNTGRLSGTSQERAQLQQSFEDRMQKAMDATPPTPMTRDERLSPETMDKLRQMSPYINQYSRYFNVDPAAVALAIGNEYETRVIKHGQGVSAWAKNLGKRAIDEGQDAFAGYGNAINLQQWDIGPGNVNIHTAESLMNDYNDELNGTSSRILSDTTLYSKYNGNLYAWAASDEGNGFLAALQMHDTMKTNSYMLRGLDRTDQAGTLYNMYRQGPKFQQLWDTEMTKIGRAHSNAGLFDSVKTGPVSVGSLKPLMRPSHGLPHIQERLQQVQQVLSYNPRLLCCERRLYVFSC